MLAPLRLAALILLFCLLSPAVARAEDVRILTLNIQLDAHDGKQVAQIVDLIRRSEADIVGLQESDKATRAIAEALGFQWVKQDDDRGVVSRYPLTLTPGRQGVSVGLPDGRSLVLFNLHLYYKPYQPYQLLRIPYGNDPFLSTEAQAIAAARAARGRDVDAGLADIARVTDPRAAVLVVGDFNEPSHLDWTERAAQAKRHPLKVAWPSTQAFADAGFRDAWRTRWPDEMRWPGETWTPTTQADDPKDHHDRIDFVLFRGPVYIARVQVVAEDTAHGQIVVTPYPTDHRGVLATIRLK